MPDKRYSLKVNGKSRTVKADVFNQNIDKFVNDMPDATIMMTGSDGTQREYRLREIADAYDSGYTFAETDTPIYVNSPAPKPKQEPAAAVAAPAAQEVPVTQEAAQQQQPAQAVQQPKQEPVPQPSPAPVQQPQQQQADMLAGYDPEVVRRFYDPSNRAGNFKDLAQIASEYEAEKQGKATRWNTTGGAGFVPPLQFPIGHPLAPQPAQKPQAQPKAQVMDRPSPLMPQEEEKISLTPFADRAERIRQLASLSPQELNAYWADRQREADRRTVEFGHRGFAYMQEGFEQAQEVDAARRLQRQDYDRKNFGDFFDKHVTPVFKQERKAGEQRASEAISKIPKYDVPGAQSGFARLFETEMHYEKNTDPEKIVGGTLQQVQKDDSFGDYVMQRMGIDAKKESADGAAVPQLSQREMDYMHNLFAKETGEVADQIVQRLYDQYQSESAPKSVLDYIAGKAFHENLASTLFNAMVRRAAGSSGMREQLRAMASEQYGKQQSWGVRMAGGAAPFAVDMLAGGFALPNMVGEAVVKGGTRLAAQQVTQQMAKRAAARGLEGAALKEATSGAAGVAERYIAAKAPILNLSIRAAGSAANFATYDMQSEVVRQIADGEFRPLDLMKEAVHGATVGAVMGAAGGTIGHVTHNAGRAGKIAGGVAGLGAETTIFGISNGLAKAQAEGADISDVDWADTMGEAFGQVVGMKAVGAVMHPREFLNRYRKSKDYDLQLNQRDLDELREAGYDFDGIFKGLGKFGETTPMEGTTISRAKEYTPGPEGTGSKRETTSEEAWVDADAYEALMRNPDISSSTKRKVAYIATGKVLMPEVVFGVQMDVDEQGRATLTTLNAQGGVIETKDYKNEDAARKDYDEIQGVSRLNTIDGLERIAQRTGNPALVDAAKGRAKADTGYDVDDVLTAEDIDRETRDAVLDSYIKHLQDAYMEQFNENLLRLGGREGGDRTDEDTNVRVQGGGVLAGVQATEGRADNADGEAGATTGTGSDEPPAPPAPSGPTTPTPPPAPTGAGPSEETLQRRGAAYDRGAQVATDQSILPGINYDVKLADARMAALFPQSDPRLANLRRNVMAAVESGDDEKADELIAQAAPRLTSQQVDALEQYRDLMETQRGVEDAVAQQTSDFEEQRRAELEPLTASDGTITPVTLQDGTTAYYKAGDLGNKYGGVIVADEDGQQKQIPTSSIVQVGEPQKAADIIDADINQFAQELEASYQQIANGQLFTQGQQVDLVIAGRPFRGTMLGTDMQSGQVVFQLEDGSRVPMTPQDAQKAVNDADMMKIQAQLAHEANEASARQQTERYAKGIKGYTEGKPDYSAEESDPQTVADFLLSSVPEGTTPDKHRANVLKNIQGEKDLLSQNTQQSWDELQRAQNNYEMSDDDNVKKARAIQDMQAARHRIEELQQRQKKWGEIRQAIMTQEERTKFEGDRMRTVSKHLQQSKKALAAQEQPAPDPIPTGQELLAQYQEQGEAQDAVTALRKETKRQWSEDLFPQLHDVRQMVQEYQQGLMELSDDEVQHLTDVLAQLEQRESALVGRSKALKQLEQSLGRLYASRNNAELSPHEKKMNQLGREKDRTRKMKLAKEAFADDPLASAILENDEPQDVYEFVARNLGYGSLNWEGLERGEHHVRGVQEMMGRDKTRSLDKGGDTYGFNAYLAPTGEGMGFDEAVHSIYTAQPDQPDGGKAYTTEDIANALEELLRTAERPTDISHRIENDRIAAAEQMYRTGLEEAEREAMDAEAWERQQEVDAYLDYLDTLQGVIPTDEAKGFISGLLADELADMERERTTYEDAMRQIAAETETNIQDYGEETSEQQPATTDGGRVDKQPQPAAVEAGVSEGEAGVPAAQPHQQASENGDTKQPTAQPGAAGTGVGTTHADGSVPVQAEAASDLDVPQELADRIRIDEDYTTGASANGDIYLQTVTIDGKHEAVKVDAPDAKGNYNGSYYEYGGKRYGDLLEVINAIDGKDAQGRTAQEAFEQAIDEMGRVEEEWDNTIRDYIGEHYPTQAVLSAKSTTPEGLAEREAMKKDEMLADMRRDEKAALDAAQKKVDEAYQRMSKEEQTFTHRLEKAKSETDTSPTEAQKKAGNYKMGHVKFGGYTMSIENPKGSVRSGVDANNKPWSVTMHDTYGYIGKKYGADGDHLDFFINDDADLDTWQGRVFVIDQKNEDGTFDEHKVMYGYPNWAAAKKAYESNYEPGWWESRVMQMMGVKKRDFDKWLADSDHKTKPYADYFRTKHTDVVSDPVSDMLATVQERKESEPQPIGTGDFGPIYDQFKGKAKEAIDFLMKKQGGEAVGALSHKDVGDIDLVWGEEGTGKSDGFGLAKLAKYHPEVLENLQGILDDMHVTSRSENRINLESDTHQAAVRLTWNEQKKKWLLTAFEKKNSVPDNTTDTGETSEGGKRNDTATPQNAVSGDKGTNKIPNIQGNREEFLPNDEEIDQRNALVDVMRKAGIDVSLKFGEGQHNLDEADGDTIASQETKAEPTKPAEDKGYQIEPRFHKKKGIEIYAVKFDEHFSREKFLELKGKVKEFGGYYSSFGKGGFIFEGSAEDARKFAESVTKGIEHEQEQQRAADTEAVAREAETIASEAEHVAEAAAVEPAKVAETVRKVDDALDKVNKQLALLGYYEGGQDVPFHESYGYMKSAEKKALKDANDLARQIGDRIGFDIGRKKIATANLAPIGGDISIHLPFEEGKEVHVNIMLDAEGDNLRMRGGYFRIDGTGKPGWYGNNQWFEPDEPLDRLLQRIESEVHHSAPEYTIKQIARQGAKPKAAPKKEQPQLMGDLFAQQMEETASKEVILEQAKGLVKEVIGGLRDIVSDEQRDTLQQWIDEAIEAVPMTERSVELDKAITTAIKAVNAYEQKKADEYQAQVKQENRLFPKNGEAQMREREDLIREAYLNGEESKVKFILPQLESLYKRKLNDEGVGLFAQADRWKEYRDALFAEWDKEKKPSEASNEPKKDVTLQPEGDTIAPQQTKEQKPINDKNDERKRTGADEGAATDAAVGVDETGADGGLQPGGTGGTDGSGNAGAEPTRNPRGTVGRKKRVVEAGSLFDAGDFGDTTEPSAGAVRVRAAQVSGSDGGRNADGRSGENAGRGTGKEEAQEVRPAAGTVAKPAGEAAGTVAKPAGEAKPKEPAKREDDGSVKDAPEKAAPLNTRNYLYPKDASEIDNMTPRERLKTNVRALEILRDLLHEGREATAAERAELGKFRGWGGIEDAVRWYDYDDLRRQPRTSPWGPPRPTEESETRARLADLLEELDPDGKRDLLGSIRGAALTSYYTPTAVARSINKFFELAGYKGGGTFIDGSMGNGVLEGTMPKAMQQRTQIYGTELDWLTGQIARQLYPDANVKIQGFQDLDMADGSFDLAGSNIPFGDFPVTDKSWGRTSDPVKRAAQQRIHNYFTVKKIDLVKPGGLLYIMTSNAIMDTKGNQIIRQYMADQCEILGAMRLPDNTFKGAGTKVVTDVIFLRKYKDGEDATRTRQGDYLEKVEKPFLSTAIKEAPGRYQTFNVEFNGYYGTHPDMLIGDVKAGGQYREDEFGLTSGLSTEEIAKKMDSLMKKHIVPSGRSGQMYDTHRSERQVHEAIRESYKGDGNYISSGNIVEQGGKYGVVIITKGNADFQEIPGLKSQGAKIKAMMPLRRAMKEIISEEIGGASDERLQQLRGELKKHYDNYVRKYGRLAENGSKFIADDIDGYTLMSLEKWRDGKFEGLSDIFTKNTIKPRLNLDTANSPAELITLSLAEYGEVRPSFMERKLGEDWLEQCGDTLFEIPFGRGYQIKDLYLSGDVKSKLEDAERAAKENPKFQKNVDALKAVIPKDIPFVGISIHMGARWVPEQVYTKFMHDLLGIDSYGAKSGITYMPEADQFQVYISASEPSGKVKDYQTPHRDATALFEAALKNNKVKITMTDSDGKEVFLEEETNSANDKIQDIREKFEDWLSQDSARVQQLEQLYNDKFNRTVIPHYDGSHLQIPGLQGMELRPHQKDAVWMLINNRGGIIDHIVGAGKTLVMQASIMEMRRMGIAKKPMIIALKATVPQMAAEFRQAFPAARILAPTEKDFAKANRKKLLSNIALNDWDCVILSHEQYGMLPHTEDVEAGVFREQLDQLDAAITLLHGGDTTQMTKKQLKGLEKRKKSLEAKMQRLLDRKVDREFAFENLGVDYLFVDECQQFKSLPYVTTHQNVKGLASPEGSARATALLCAARYLQELHQGDRGITLLSGTTISNSLVELYSLFQYVRPNKMRELGFSTFDAWAANFAECSTELEFNHTNELVMSSRFRTFDNVPELAKLYTEVADVRNDLNLKLPKPKMKVHEVIVPASDALAEIADECAKMCRTKNGRYFGIPDKTASGKDQPWALLATNISTKAAINVKLVDTSLDDGDGGKIRYVCDNVKEIYDKFHEQKGTQMIFCDLGVPGPDKEYDVYNDIINRLVNEYGIPRSEIVDIHVANTDAKKKALFKKVNDGDVRVLIAGAKNGGTGVNVQKRLIAVHHVDMSWNPANITQENGRAARQGNWLAKEHNNDQVEVYYYATEKSLDLYKYQLVSSKQAMIDKFKAGATSDERSFDEGEADDDSGFSPASIVALLSGNPIIMEKAKQDKKVEKLIKSKRQYMVEHEQRVYEYEADQQHLKNFENLVERNAEDLKVLEQNGFKPDDKGVYPAIVTVYSDKDPKKKTFEKPGEAGKRMKYLVNSGDKVVLEGYGMTAEVGFPEDDGRGAMVRRIRLKAPSGITYAVELSNDDTMAGTSLRRLLSQVIRNADKYKANVEAIKHRLEGGAPGEANFPKEAELQAALEEKKRIDAEYAKLSAEKKPAGEGEDTTMKRRGAAELQQHTEQQIEQYRREAIETAEQLGGMEVHFDQRSAEPGVKGWFDTGDNSVHVVMDAVEGVDDLKRTIFHEKLGHEGLKALLGSNEGVNQWGQFIFGSAGRKLRQRIIDRADHEGYEWSDPQRFSKAAQEVFADIAEAGPRNADEFSLWRKAKHHLIEKLKEKGIRIPGILNDHDLRYYVLKTGEALKVWDGMSAEAQSEAGNRMYSRAGKPRKRKDESMAQYLQRLRSWEKWKIAEEQSAAAGDPMPDKEQIDKKWDDDYHAALDAWKQANGIGADEQGAGEFPKRKPGESPQEYAMRVADYEERADAWQGAPNYFDYMQRAGEEYRDEYEAWKSRYDLTEAACVDMSMFEGKGEDGPKTDIDVEAEMRMGQDLAQAVGVAVDGDGARRQAKVAVIERRKNLESSNAEDAIFLYDLRKKTDEAAKAMSQRTGEAVTGKQLREALPFIIEGTYFEDVLRDEKGNVVSIEDISDQLPIKKGPELDALLDEIKTWYDDFYHVLEDAGLRYDAGYIADGYVNHVWDKKKSDPKAWEQVVENYQRTKSPNMRHREIDTYREGMEIGLVPKYTDICDIMAHYSRQNNEAVANKKLLDDLSFIVVQEVNGDGEVTANLPLLDSKKPSFTADRYVMYEVPGVGDVWVLKDIQKRFASVFGTMRTPDVSDWLSKMGKAYDLTSSTMKKIQLSISGFHMGALTEVAMAQMRPDRAMKALCQYIIYDSFIKQGTVPAYAHPEDFKFAASHLVQLGATEDYAASDVNAITATFRAKMKEWYEEENAGKKVVGAAATPLAFALDMVNKGMDKVLWNYLHDGLKIACFKMFAEQIDERARKQGLSEEQREQLLDEAGQYVNDTFGGQYWELLNVSPALLKWLRRAFLSPDWLISTQRHFFANFGFGSLYSESGFMNYLRYNADNIKRVFGMDVERDELRRFRSSNAKKCYILGVCGFFYTMMNALNAYFRAKDEEKEKEKADEIRKENPDYKSPYELAYPDGMKWYDYTMLGNSLGQQTHLFMGRYLDGTETYVRWGKQFREFPEMFMGRHGVEFPTPMIERMMGKSNPMISLTRDNLGALGVWGFTNSNDIKDIQAKYGKEIGVLAMNARHFLPFSVPTQSEKEFKAMDLLMPSQKGFTRYKTVDFFKTYILAGDMEGVTRTYQAAVMNGIDAEKCLKAAISTIKATQREEMKDGVIDLQSAMEKFDESEDYRAKAVLRNRIIAYLAESNYKAFTREDAQEQIDAFLQGDGVAEKDNDRYISLLTSGDVRDDYKLSALGKQAKGYVDKVKTCEDSQAQSRMAQQYQSWFAIQGIVNKARRDMNQLKGQLGKGHDAEVMEQIRQIRRQAQTEIDHVQPPR